MSEHLDEPSFGINVGDERLEARPDNARLYTFVGQTALKGGWFENSSANHIFFMEEDQEPDEDGLNVGKYVFISEEATSRIVGFMAMNGYRCYLNQTEIPGCDMDAYGRFVNQQVESEETPDYLPDDWTE